MSFNINIISPATNDKNKNETRKIEFAFDLNASGEVALNDHIQHFCALELNDLEDCTTLIRDRFMVKHTNFEEFKSDIPSFLQPNKVSTSFSQELLLSACPAPPSDSESYFTCIREAQQAIRSVKVITMANRMSSLMNIMHKNTLVNLTAGWDDDIEGHILMFFDKVIQLQSLADDARVETICEVGFNLGHSAMNWMIANPIAKILTFDLSQYAYTAAAINAFEVLFPKRIITLIEGDSKITIPNFANMFNIHKGKQDGFKCNLIFIDGSHYFNNAYADIVNLAPFANSSYHAVVVDDMKLNGVRKAVVKSVTEGMLSAGREVNTPHSLCHMADLVRQGPYKGSYVFQEKSAEENCTSDLGDDSIYIGEYIL